MNTKKAIVGLVIIILVVFFYVAADSTDPLSVAQYLHDASFVGCAVADGETTGSSWESLEVFRLPVEREALDVTAPPDVRMGDILEVYDVGEEFIAIPTNGITCASVPML